MFKPLPAGIAAVLALVWLVPADAAAQSRSDRTKKAKQQTSERLARRTVARTNGGLCQRDTGKSTSSLDFRNRCDMAEFWTRMDELGSGGID